ncbi:unnamed protein product [Protopolystoma xenopodis]|uniref:Uncharacterized protein n=1 Tax=Protopolystoma xenopodis TaxID=117903 RepID=A0A448WIS9_9PLAT|nr:unnamed protein product [Protopolystoma xenopodis]
MYDHDVIQPEDKRITLSQLKQLMADPLVDYLALVVDLICSPTCAETHPTLAHSVRFIIPDKGSKVDTDGIANLFNTRLSRLRTVQTKLRMELEPLRVLILRHRVTKACIINNGGNRVIMDINAIIEKGNNKELEKNSKNAEEDTKNEILPKSRLQFHLLEINETAEEIEEQAHWLCKSVGSFNGMAWLRPPTELAGGRIWLLDTFDEHSEEIEKKENAKRDADKFYEPRLLQSCHIKYIVSRLSIDRVLLVAKDAPADVDNVETLIDVYQSRVGCPCLLVPADWASNDLERMRSELARITNFLANGQCPQRMSSENGLQENDQHRPSHRIMVLGGGNGGAVCLAVALLMLLLRWRMPAAYHHLRSARSRPPLLPVQLTCLWQLDQALFAGLTKTRSAHVAGPYDKGGLGKSKVVKGKLKRRAAFFRRQDTEVPLPILAHTLTGIKPKTFFLTDIELLEDTTQVEQQGLSQVDDSSKHRIKDLALKKKLDRHTKKSGEKSKKYLKWINREIDPNSLLEMHSNEVLGQNGEKPNGKDHAQIMSEDTLVMRITAEDLEGFDTDELMQSNK